MRPRTKTSKLIAACAAVTVVLTQAGHAGEPQEASAEDGITVEAQPLADALREFSTQSGLQVAYVATLADEVRSKGTRNAATPTAALADILDDTGLNYRFVNESTVAIAGAANDEAPDLGNAPSASSQEVRAQTPAPRQRAMQTAIRDPDGDTASRYGRGNLPSEEIVVVGTLLRNSTPTSTVITFDRDDIERGGYSSTAEVLRELPQNFSGKSPATTTFRSGNVGATTQIDLRGLGSEATLTLVNGRRISSGAGDSGRAVDVGMIPVSAIERIDVLMDGASALYGSDAIGGVVNIVLRKDFEGAETTVQYGENSTGADDVLVSQVLGKSWSSGRILGAAQYARHDALRYQEVGIETMDFRARGGSDGRIPFLGSPGTLLPAGFFAGQPFTTFSGPAGDPVFFAALPPGAGESLSIDDLGFNQMVAGDVNLDEFVPEQESISGYLTVEQDVGSLTLFADVVYAHREAVLSGGITGDYLFVPSTNAYSPFEEDVYVAYLFNDIGSLVNEIESDGWFANLGVRGRLGDGDWTWEIVGSRSEDESATRFMVPDPVALAMLLSSGDPEVAFNPFGDGSGQSAEAVATATAQNTTTGLTSMDAVSAQLQGSLWEMPGGSARLALGAEHRRQELAVVAEQGSEDTPLSNGSRHLNSVYAELHLPLVGKANAKPLLRELAVSAAVRYEDYSDRFGDTTNPRLGLLWRPAEELVLKANWGTSFRAPSLNELYGRNSSGLTQVVDPKAPGGPAAVFPLRVSGGNPDLREETASTYSASAEYRPRWLEGARVTVSRFRTEYDDRIRGLLDGLTLPFILQLEDSLPPGIIVRDAAGNLSQINATNINSASTLIEGYDFAAGYTWTTRQLGGFDLSASATSFSKYEVELLPGSSVLDIEGTTGNPPEWRGRLGFRWFNGPWSAGISASHVPSLHNDDPSAGIVIRDINSQTTVDLQLGFTSPATSGWLEGITARLGANNLFDERPPFVDGRQYRGLDATNHVVKGRTVYLRLSKGLGSAAESRSPQ